MRKDHVRGRIRKALTKGMSVILILSSSFGTGAFAAPGTITEPEEAEIVSEGDAADTAETVGYAQDGIITGFKPLEKDTMNLEYKLALFRVIEELPQTVTAYFDGDTKGREISVSWECLDDYDEDLVSYRFRAVPEGFEVTHGALLPEIRVNVPESTEHATGGVLTKKSMNTASPEEDSRDDSIKNDSLYAEAKDLPSYYNSYAEGKLPPVRNQAQYGVCWSFAALGCIEADLIHDGKADPSEIDFSELHLSYYTTTTYKDPRNNLEGESLEYFGSDKYNFLDSAGNALKSGQALINLVGAAAEKDVPYSDAAGMLKGTVRYPDRYAQSLDQVNVKGIYQIDGCDHEKIKNAILEHGGVEKIIAAPESEEGLYFSDTYDSYITTSNLPNHVVMIVGWDDNFPRENFPGHVPARDGAWLMRNSWGLDDYGMNGYFWLSYEDTATNGGAVFAYDADTVLRDNCYAYSRYMSDFAGQMKNYEGKHSFAQSFHVDRGEIVKEVGFEVYDFDDNGCDIEVKVEDDAGHSSHAVLHPLHPGYHTAEVSAPFEITAENGANVRVTLTVTGTKYSLPWETDTQGVLDGMYLKYVTKVNGGGVETDGRLDKTIDSRIRLFTDNSSKPAASVSLNSRKISLRHGEMEVISLDPSCEAYNDPSNVTWKTDMGSIAILYASEDGRSATVATNTKPGRTRIRAYYKYNEDDASYEEMAECEVDVIPYSIAYTGMPDDVIFSTNLPDSYFPNDESIGTLCRIYRPGYDLEYYLDSTSGFPIDTGMLWKGIVTGDITIYPKWKPREISVCYEQPDGSKKELGTYKGDDFPLSLPDAAAATGITAAAGWSLTPDGKELIDTLSAEQAFCLDHSTYQQNDSVTLFPQYGTLRLKEGSDIWVLSGIADKGYKVTGTLERIDADGKVTHTFEKIPADDISVSSNGENVIYTASWIRNGAVTGQAVKLEKKPVSGNPIESVSIDYDSVSENGISIGLNNMISGLKVLVSPVGAVSGNVLWTSENEGIAKVRASKANGTGTITVNAVGKGATRIKAYIDGSDTPVFSFPVTVFDPDNLVIKSEKSFIYPETTNKRFKDTFTYEGAPCKPVPVVIYKSDVLTEGKDYKLTYKNNKGVTTAGRRASVTITSKKKAFSPQTIEFDIEAADISAANEAVTAEDLYYPYASRITVKPAVKMTGSDKKTRTLSYGKDYTFKDLSGRIIEVSSLTPSADGYRYTGQVILKGIGNYTGERAVAVTVEGKDAVRIGKVRAGKIPVQKASGRALTPSVNLSYSGTLLKEGDDYTAEYYDNIETGTARIVITGKGRYVGKRTLTFKIRGMKLTKEMFAMKDLGYDEYLTPDSQTIDALIITTLDTGDYSYSLPGDLKGMKGQYLRAGKYTLTVHGRGAYEGTRKLSFKVTPKVLERAWFETAASPVYPLVKGGVRPYDTNKKLKPKIDYTVTYSNNKAAGNAQAVIRGKGNHTGVIVIPFKIVEE